MWFRGISYEIVHETASLLLAKERFHDTIPLNWTNHCLPLAFNMTELRDFIWIQSLEGALEATSLSAVIIAMYPRQDFSDPSHKLYFQLKLLSIVTMWYDFEGKPKIHTVLVRYGNAVITFMYYLHMCYTNLLSDGVIHGMCNEIFSII